MQLDDLMPKLRGTWMRDADLGARTWFRTGGRAEILFEPADQDDLVFFLQHCDREIPVCTLGLGSNVLIRDGGVRGVVIILGAAFRELKIDGARINVGTALPARQVAQEALRAELTGFEFMRGIPGTIGGCVAMNAGAYGGVTADIFIQAAALDRAGRVHIFTKDEMAFGYRQSIAEGQYIFTRTVLEGRRGDAAKIKKQMDEIVAQRRESQPPGARTGGSTFKNPHKEISDKKAWQLIAQAGCRDLSYGGAYVCDKHCNFLVNGGRAKASDIENLGEDIRARVAAQTGIKLDWEIRRLGEVE